MQHILDKVVTLKKKYDTTNPFEIAGSMNVNILFHELGSLKGYYTYIRRSNYIVINSKLDEKMKHVICSHELGHNCLHKEFAKYTPMKDYMLFDMSSKPEREANLFSAELILSDDDVLDAINSQYSFQTTASMLNVPLELLDFKFQALKYKGYHFVSPFNSRADFLKK